MTEYPEALADESPPITRRRNRRQLSSTQVMFAVILTIGLMLAIQFSSRIEADQDLDQIKNTILDEIELLQQEHKELTEQLAFVDSDAYVENWAHEEARMVREGEVLVIPKPIADVALQTASSTEEVVPILVDTELPEPQTWELWWALFFDQPPPEFGS